MKIALVSQEYPPETAHGGIGSQTWNKAHALVELGHEVQVVSCAGRQGPDRIETTQAGIVVHRLAPPGQEPGREIEVNEQAVYMTAYSWLVCRYLNRLEQAGPFDVIDVAEYSAEGFAYQINRRPWRYTPVAVQLHAPLAMFAERIGWPQKGEALHDVGTFLEGISIRSADALMACSENIADFTSDYYGIPRQSIRVVHCGVDADMFCPNGSGLVSAKASQRPPTVLFVGNITPSKGLVSAAEAVLQLRSKHPRLRLQILGRGDDALLKRLQDQARSAGASDALEVVGFVQGREAVAQLYREADIFCSPAQHEPGVANVYLEAMGCGRPVIAATTGAAREAVLDGKTGFLVPPGDSQATAAAIDRLISDDDLRRRFGLAARRRVEEYFSMERYAERILSVYEIATQNSLTAAQGEKNGK